MANQKTGKASVDGAKAAENDETAAVDQPEGESPDSVPEDDPTFAGDDLQDATDADVVAESAEDVPSDTPATSEDPVPEEAANETTEAGGAEADDEPESDITVTSADDVADTEKTDPQPEPQPAPPPVQAAPEQSGGGFFPLLIGGGLAAAIGWGVATFTAPEAPLSVDPSRVDALEGEVRSVESAIAELEIPSPVDLSPLQNAQADLNARLDDFAIRLEALEVSAGQQDGSAGAEILGQLRGELSSISDELVPRIEALEAKADELGNAEAEAEAALRRAAKNEVATAIRDGIPYPAAAAALDDLPEILAANAESGLPPKAQLAEGFDDLARSALDAARAAGSADAGIGGLASSLLNIRSTEPRAGDDPDAVLSRIEAAVRAGDLSTALSEIDALPSEAADALADWSAKARTRLDAEAALQDYLEG